MSSIETVSPALSIHPYQPSVSYPQRLAWGKLFQLELKFARFLDMLKRIYADTPFLEALKKAPSHIQYLRELLSKKGEPKGGSVIPIEEVCSSTLQSPSKLQDSGSFSIPCVVGDLQIKGALCDLGASVSIMPSSFYSMLQLQDL